MKMKISFIGLGKLGLPLATNFAKNKIEVIAIDKNVKLIENLSNGKTPWVEEGLQKNIKKAQGHIEYTTDYSGASETDVSIILVNTPSIKKDGSFSNLYVEQSLKELCDNFVKTGKKSHHFILSSTVMPGSIVESFIPLIESITGWTINEEFGFSYIPDFVAIGKIITNFENPDFLLIGSSSHSYADEAKTLYQTIIKNDSEIKILTLPEAELSKVALNAYITTKISFANYLGMLANKLDPKINIDNVTNTIGLDKRIGTKYFKAGGPYGGTCFPRDTWAFAKISEKVGMKSDHMIANEKINDELVKKIFLSIIEDTPAKIGLVGIGFKPGTSVITEGLAHKLIKKLKRYDCEIHVYDHLKEETYNNLLSVVGYKDIRYHDDLCQLENTVNTIVYCNDEQYDMVHCSFTCNKAINPWRI